MAVTTKSSTGLNFMARLSQGRDAYIVILMIVVVAMMVIPLPTVIIDLLIALNLAFVVLILVVTLYSTSALALSTFPALLLISTLFRLALTISTTRLILSKAEAGDIIRTFGEFVVAGNVVVGLVIFLIITVVQFVVITKGAERIAEVGARFQLDALPGKQMSIDAELRNGDITREEGRERRVMLEKESQFYGAMDGAMKFVKGDAIAGLIIVAVNLIGGLTVGMAQQGMALGEAGTVYSLLTVGDGLVSQIPALFIAISAGMLVTRVATDKEENLGSEIATQLTEHTHLLTGAGIIVMIASLVPGFPTLIFLLIGLAFMTPGILIWRRGTVDEDDTTQLAITPLSEQAGGDTALLPKSAGADIQIRLGSDLGTQMAAADLLARAESDRTQLIRDLGGTPPSINFTVSDQLAPAAFRLDVDGFMLIDIDLERVQLLLNATRDLTVQPAGLPYAVGYATLPGSQDLREAAVTILSLLKSVQRNYFSENFSVDNMHALLEQVARRSPFLIDNLRKSFPLPKLTSVFRQLISDGVPMWRADRLCQTLIEHGSHEDSIHDLSELLRTQAAWQICQPLANEHNVINVVEVYRHIERGILDTQDLAEDVLDQLVQALGYVKSANETATTPVIVVNAVTRPILSKILKKYNIYAHIVTYDDILVGFELDPQASVS